MLGTKAAGLGRPDDGVRRPRVDSEITADRLHIAKKTSPPLLLEYVKMMIIASLTMICDWGDMSVSKLRGQLRRNSSKKLGDALNSTETKLTRIPGTPTTS